MNENNRLFTACSLMVTEQCNLRCTYCFEKHKNKYMSLNTVKNSLDFLTLNAVKSTKLVDITFFGGEPTMNPEAIIYAIEYSKELINQFNINFHFNIITNCVNIPEKLEDYLMENFKNINMTIQLSIDGVKEVQDKYRITPNGKPSYHMVEKTIEKWKNIVRTKTDKIEEVINIHGCINKDTLPMLFTNFIHFIDVLGIDNLWFLPIAEENWDKDDVKIYLEETTKIVNYIKNKANQLNDISYLRRHAPFDRRNCNGGIFNKPCGAGDNYCSITSDGLIYPCHQFYFNDIHNELCLGDVFNKDINEHIRRFFIEYDGGDLSCKKDCKNGSCYRCIAANFTHNKSCIAQTKEHYCQLMSIDRIHQLDLKKMEEEKMGLLNNNNNNYNQEQQNNMICSNHTSDTRYGCDVVYKKNQNNCDEDDCCKNNKSEDHVCNCNDEQNEHTCNCKNESNNDVLELLIKNQIEMGNLLNEVVNTLKKKRRW